MGLAQTEIDKLDRQLRTRGQTVRLQRAGVRDEDTFVTFRAFVRGYKPSELNGGIEQGDSVVVISPTDLEAAGIKDPIVEADRIHVSGSPRAVRFCNPIEIEGRVVRWDAWVSGPM